MPRLVTDWIRDEPGTTYRDVDATLVFVDVSGFTKLSERLARLGKLGAEELTDLIGSCFRQLLAAAYANDGSLIKFGGDALLLLFQDDGHELRACSAAVGMRTALRDVGSLSAGGGRIRLRMSIGVHSGSFQFFLIGGSHRELVVAGPAASRTVDMEAAAEAGDILVSPETASSLPGSVVGARKGPGYLLLRKPPGLGCGEVVTESEPLASAMRECLPADLRNRVLAEEYEGEHKRVTVAFMHFDGTDELVRTDGTAVTAAHLDRFIRTVQVSAERYGVCFLGTDVDRDGGKVILTTGAPSSTGNDEERMLLALREILDAGCGVDLRIGVNSGHVFAGEVGPSYRRTYTVMGDSVNLAARVMAKAAPGQILATASVTQRSRTRFDTVALEPFFVKGKAAPVQAFSVGHVVGSGLSEQPDETAFVGRRRELEVLGEALGRAIGGHGHLIEMVGEPGIGKSQLVTQFKQRADGVRCLEMQCELFEIATPYFPFRQLLRGLLDLKPGLDENAASESVMRRLAEWAPQLIRWAPLLGIVLGVDIPSTREVQELEEQFRRPRLEQATVALMSALLRGPSLLVVEDAQWMDEPSADLLHRIVNELPNSPWLVCVTRRDVDTGFWAPSAPEVTTLRTPPLGAADAQALVETMTEDKPLAPHEVCVLAERSGGNPLFLRELVAAAEQAGTVDNLPDSVEAVIVARIDQLAATDRALLRYLSVLGPSIDWHLAELCLQDELPSLKSKVWSRLSDFITVDGSGVMRFGNSLIREAAYDGLPYSVRRRLHAVVGEVIERDFSEHLTDYAGLLSLHFLNARRYEAAWSYARIAAEHARRIYANIEAAELYERALFAARQAHGALPAEVAQVREALGDVQRRLGKYPEAIEAYRSARRLVRGDPVRTAELLLKQGQVLQVASRYADAIRWFHRARRMLQQSDGPAAGHQRAQVAAAFASVRQHQGRPRDVIRWCGETIEEGMAAGDQNALAHAYFLLDTAYVALGKWDQVTHSDKALALYAEIGDLWGQGVVLNNLGTQSYWRGRWDEAISYYERGRAARERIGDAVNASYGTINVAEILADQGRLEEAEPLFRQVLRVWKAANDRASVAYAKSHLGRVAYRRGRIDEGLAMLEEAKAEFEDVGRLSELVEADGRIAECKLVAGDTQEAIETADRALARIGSVSGASVHAPMLHRVRGYALLQIGERDAARRAFEHSLTVARDRDLDYELALTLRAIAAVSRESGRDDSWKALLDESQATLERLGVVRVFEPLGPALREIAAPNILSPGTE